MSKRLRISAGAVWFTAALVVAYGYFYQGGGWNQSSRMDLVRAIVDDGSLEIDPYARNTGDMARHGGHLYSDKAPGVALTAAPFVAVARAVVPSSALGWVWLHWFATLVVAGIPTIIAALALRGLAVRLGAGPGGAWIAAAVFAVGTPAWAYATLLWGHALATCCLVLALVFAVRAADDPSRRTLVGLGLVSGWAILTEFPTAPAIAIALALAAWQLRRRDRSLVRAAALVVAGALLPAALLLGYNTLAFGSPFHLGYQDVAGFAGMKQGLLGVEAPSARILCEILVGEKRGLLLCAPVLAVAPLGLAYAIRTRGLRPVGIACAVIIAYYISFNAGYQYWDGGSCVGPRHMAPALPLLALGVGVVWSRAAKLPRRIEVLVRSAVAIAAVAGFVIAFVSVSVGVQPPGAWPRPFADHLWPAFVDGDLSRESRTVVDRDSLGDDSIFQTGAWNMGHVLRLSGHTTFLPLAGALILIAAGAIATRRRDEHES